jgi:hypothetical protein
VPEGPRTLGYCLTCSPTSRLMPLSYRLTSFGSPTLQGGYRPNRHQPALSPPSRGVPAWLRPPLTAPGSWWATTNCLVSRSRLLPLPHDCGVVHGSVSRAGKYQDCRKRFRQNQCQRFSKPKRGQTRWGAARSKAGEASLNDASVCSKGR